jgi:hypothetical protein
VETYTIILVWNFGSIAHIRISKPSKMGRQCQNTERPTQSIGGRIYLSLFPMEKFLKAYLNKHFKDYEMFMLRQTIIVLVYDEVRDYGEDRLTVQRDVVTYFNRYIVYAKSKEDFDWRVESLKFAAWQMEVAFWEYALECKIPLR